MILEQFYLGCLAHASYLVGDPDSGDAAVIDPRRDVDVYLERAEQLGLRIRDVLLTHFHADFVAGHLELRDRVGARIYLGRRASAEYEFTPLADGDSIRLGNVRLEAAETPGHTPESISILVYDVARDDQRPHAVLTGDTLFIGDVGRPDLAASQGWSASDLAALLYDSLHGRLLQLPDDTLVYPAHGAGSFCGKNMSSDTVSTIGVQRRLNDALQPMERDDFVAWVTADQPDAPSYFAYDAALNTRERPVLDDVLTHEVSALTVDDMVDIDQVQILDTRDPVSYAGAHVRGSINVGLDGSYATWAGAVLDRERPIVLITDPGREEESALRLGRIGFDRVAGYLGSGMRALEHRPELVDTSLRITAGALAEELGDDDPPIVLDVRTEREWREHRIAGSVNVPLARLVARIEELPRDRSIVVVCQSGYRSSIASSVLRGQGFGDTVDLVGGMGAWSS